MAYQMLSVTVQDNKIIAVGQEGNSVFIGSLISDFEALLKTEEFSPMAVLRSMSDSSLLEIRSYTRPMIKVSEGEEDAQMGT